MRENLFALAWKLLCTCVKTLPHLRENFSGPAWKRYAHAWKLFRTCAKTFPDLRENFSGPAWKLFRNCVKTFPHLREKFSGSAWKLLRTCVKNFPHMRDNFSVHAWNFCTCVKTFTYWGIWTYAIAYIYQLWTWSAHLGQSYNVIIKEDNKSSTLSLQFIEIISKTAQLFIELK